MTEGDYLCEKQLFEPPAKPRFGRQPTASRAAHAQRGRGQDRLQSEVQKFVIRDAEAACPLLSFETTFSKRSRSGGRIVGGHCRRLRALLGLQQPTVRGQALAAAACRRRQRKYESPQSTPVAAAQPHASGPSPTERWATSAEPMSKAKPA